MTNPIILWEEVMMASSRVRVIKMGTHGWNPDLVCKVRPADRIQYPKGIPRASLWRRRETLQAAGFSGSQPRHDRWVFALHLPWEVNWKEIDFLEHLKPRRVILWEIQMSSTSKRKHASTRLSCWDHRVSHWIALKLSVLFCKYGTRTMAPTRGGCEYLMRWRWEANILLAVIRKCRTSFHSWKLPKIKPEEHEPGASLEAQW